MGSYIPELPHFDVLHDTRPHDTTLPAFMVSTTRGFLPRQDPIVGLPPDFDVLESILTRMPIKTLTGERGLLGLCTLGEVVLKELPDLTDAVDKYEHDLPMMNALYRDYSFLGMSPVMYGMFSRLLTQCSFGLLA